MPTLRELAEQDYKFTGSGGTMEAVDPGTGEIIQTDFDLPSRPVTAREKPEQSFTKMVKQDYARRDSFEKEVFNQIGFNPFQVSVIDEINRFDNGDGIKNFFDATFDGIMSWRDKRRMSPEQRTFWNLALKNAHANITQQVKTNRENGLAKYKRMMTRFDSEAQAVMRAKQLDYNNELRRINKIENEEFKRATAVEGAQKAMNKRALNNMKLVNDALKEMAKQEQKSAEDKEKSFRELVKTEAKVLDFGVNMYKQSPAAEPGGRMPPSTLELINLNRTKFQKPQLIEIQSVDDFVYIPEDELTEEHFESLQEMSGLEQQSDILPIETPVDFSGITTPEQFLEYVNTNAQAAEDDKPGSGNEFARKSLDELAKFSPELYKKVKEEFRKR